MRCEKFFRVPFIDLPSNANTERAHIKTGYLSNPSLFGENALPKGVHPLANASDRAKSGNDNASSAHVVTGLARASTYCFIQRKVLLATSWMKKLPIIGSTIRPRARTRN